MFCGSGDDVLSSVIVSSPSHENKALFTRARASCGRPKWNISGYDEHQEDKNQRLIQLDQKLTGKTRESMNTEIRCVQRAAEADRAGVGWSTRIEYNI